MKLLIRSVIVAMLLAAAPVWAHDGHGHGRGHWKHGHHGHRHHVREHVVVREFVQPVRPIYYPVYAAPAPGIHIVVPNVFIPFR